MKRVREHRVLKLCVINVLCAGLAILVASPVPCRADEPGAPLRVAMQELAYHSESYVGRTVISNGVVSYLKQVDQGGLNGYWTFIMRGMDQGAAAMFFMIKDQTPSPMVDFLKSQMAGHHETGMRVTAIVQKAPAGGPLPTMALVQRLDAISDPVAEYDSPVTASVW